MSHLRPNLVVAVENRPFRTLYRVVKPAPWRVIEQPDGTLRTYKNEKETWLVVDAHGRQRHYLASDLKETSVKDVLDFQKAVAEQGNWVPASGGTEPIFTARSGKRLQYVYQPSTGKHAYLDVDSDIILSDEEAQMHLGRAGGRKPAMTPAERKAKRLAEKAEYDARQAAFLEELKRNAAIENEIRGRFVANLERLAQEAKSEGNEKLQGQAERLLGPAPASFGGGFVWHAAREETSKEMRRRGYPKPHTWDEVYEAIPGRVDGVSIVTHLMAAGVGYGVARAVERPEETRALALAAKERVAAEGKRAYASAKTIAGRAGGNISHGRMTQLIENLAKESAAAGDLLQTGICYRALKMDGSLKRVALTASERAKVMSMSPQQARAICESIILDSQGRAGGFLGAPRGSSSRVRPGDRVRFTDARGATRSGRVVMASSHAGAWVVNIGGRHGTPMVVDEVDLIVTGKGR